MSCEESVALRLMSFMASVKVTWQLMSKKDFIVVWRAHSSMRCGSCRARSACRGGWGGGMCTTHWGWGGACAPLIRGGRGMCTTHRGWGGACAPLIGGGEGHVHHS